MDKENGNGNDVPKKKGANGGPRKLLVEVTCYWVRTNYEQLLVDERMPLIPSTTRSQGARDFLFVHCSRRMDYFHCFYCLEIQYSCVVELNSI